MVIFDNGGGGYLFDELLDFSSDIENTDDDDDGGKKYSKKKPKLLPSPSDSRQPPLQLQDDPSRSFLEECAEEELEWLSNKDAFPTVDTFVDIIPVNSLKHESPISVLENSNSSSFSGNGTVNNNNHAVITSCCSGGGLAPPVRRPRSRRGLKRKRGGYVDVPCQQWFLWCSINQLGEKNEKSSSGGGGNKGKVVVTKSTSSTSNTSGRKCQHCGSEKTPQWRAGPTGPKTLCNACGVRYKSGRLCPEYRPASSPTFSSVLHSNSHRKILEMKRLKQCTDMVNPVDTG